MHGALGAVKYLHSGFAPSTRDHNPFILVFIPAVSNITYSLYLWHMGIYSAQRLSREIADRQAGHKSPCIVDKQLFGHVMQLEPFNVRGHIETHPVMMFVSGLVRPLPE